MRNKVILSVLFSILLGCTNKVRNQKNAKNSNSNIQQDTASIGVNKKIQFQGEVEFDTNGDTTKMTIFVSNYIFHIRYLNNKPQGVIIDDFRNFQWPSHFKNAERGAYFIPATDLSEVTTMGQKYTANNGGIDVIFKRDSNLLRMLKVWNIYANDGVTYEFKNANKGLIKSYIYVNGECTDSSSFIKSGK